MGVLLSVFVFRPFVLKFNCMFLSILLLFVFFCISVCPSVRPSVRPSVCLSVCFVVLDGSFMQVCIFFLFYLVPVYFSYVSPFCFFCNELFRSFLNLLPLCIYMFLSFSRFAQLSSQLARDLPISSSFRSHLVIYPIDHINHPVSRIFLHKYICSYLCFNPSACLSVCIIHPPLYLPSKVLRLPRTSIRLQVLQNASPDKSACDPPKYCACHANQCPGRTCSKVLCLPRNSARDHTKYCACHTIELSCSKVLRLSRTTNSKKVSLPVM